MKQYDSHNPNVSSEVVAATPRRRPAPLGRHEVFRGRIRREALGRSSVRGHILPLPPEDTKQLQQTVHEVMDYFQGGELSRQAARMIRDESTGSLVLLRAFAALGNLGITGAELEKAQELSARIADVAASVLAADEVA